MDRAPLPARNGFRLRGLAMTRIETFTDAAFAFALTLLVLSLEPPTDFAALAPAPLNAMAGWAYAPLGAIMALFGRARGRTRPATRPVQPPPHLAPALSVEPD